MRSPYTLVKIQDCWEVGVHDATRELLATCKFNVNLERLVHWDYCTFQACQSCHLVLFIPYINCRLKYWPIA